MNIMEKSKAMRAAGKVATKTATKGSAAKAGKALDVDLATTKPGTPGGIFMRQFWLAVHRSAVLRAGRARVADHDDDAAGHARLRGLDRA